MLTSERKTAIVEARVDRMLKRAIERAKAYNGDGAMMGDIHQPDRKRWDMYWAATPNLSDIELITDPGYETRVRNALDRQPVNPFWLNQLRIPGLFTATARDFMRVNEKAIKLGWINEMAPSTSPASTPIAAGGGLPLPQTPASSTPQPEAGGGGGGYGVA